MAPTTKLHGLTVESNMASAHISIVRIRIMAHGLRKTLDSYKGLYHIYIYRDIYI